MADTLPRLSGVIPLYKEEDNVERLIDELHSALEPYPGEFEFVLVDDGSTDRRPQRKTPVRTAESDCQTETTQCCENDGSSEVGRYLQARRSTGDDP